MSLANGWPTEWWDDLADDELRSRLSRSGDLSTDTIEAVVARRDHDPRARAIIAMTLGEG